MLIFIFRNKQKNKIFQKDFTTCCDAEKIAGRHVVFFCEKCRKVPKIGQKMHLLFYVNLIIMKKVTRKGQCFTVLA